MRMSYSELLMSLRSDHNRACLFWTVELLSIDLNSFARLCNTSLSGIKCNLRLSSPDCSSCNTQQHQCLSCTARTKT